MNNKKCYGPFQLWVLNNFPFTIDDWDSITQYQMLCKCLGALKEQLDINSDLYKKISDLENYLANLDLQEYVDNKIDEMVEDGTLQEIITEYLQINGVLAFNTVSDMISATNIINGSVCRTLGLNTYNDGKGAFYKIRTITSEDTVDGVNIIALNISNTLIAEKMPDYNINTINQQINNINQTITNITTDRYIMIGDSYVTGTLNGVGNATDGWAKRIKDNLNLSDNNCYIYGEGASGFTVAGHYGNKFIDLLTNNLNNIANHDTITKIIVCGGLNDASAQEPNIELAINDFISTAKENFPNAKIYIGCIGTTSEISSSGTTLRRNTNHISLVAYKRCINYGGIYLNGVESILKDYSLMGTDYYHPSVEGYNALAYGIVQSLETGNYSKTTVVEEVTFTGNINTVTESSTFHIYDKITNDILFLNISGQITFNSGYNLLNPEVVLLNLNSYYLRKNYGSDLLLPVSLAVGSSVLGCIGTAYINDNNQLVLKFTGLPDGITNAPKFNIYASFSKNIND